MFPVIGALLCFLALPGCATLSDRYRQPGQQMPSDLLSGVSIFGEEVHSDEVPAEDILAVSPKMQAYVERNTAGRRQVTARFRRLMTSLIRDGYFNSNYQANRTYTAAATFDEKAGNCLSYTSMFIALSREAGLNARYQIVEMPPNWDAESGFLIRYTHVNVLLKGVRLDKSSDDEFSVDFNDIHPDPEAVQTVITDEYATSLFYANRSVNLFRAGENRVAFAYLRRAIELVPDNTDHWINLAALYSKLEDHQSAIRAYRWVLTLDSSSRGAISGLGRAYQALGDSERAEYYNSQVVKYREGNPFYHFAIAQTEFERERYPEALLAINTAIDLKKRTGRFHFMKGLTEQKLGDFDAARDSFRRAERLGSYSDLERRYRDELNVPALTSSY